MKTKVTFYKKLFTLQHKISKLHGELLSETSKNTFIIANGNTIVRDSDLGHLLRVRLNDLHREKENLVKNK